MVGLRFVVELDESTYRQLGSIAQEKRVGVPVVVRDLLKIRESYQALMDARHPRKPIQSPEEQAEHMRAVRERIAVTLASMRAVLDSPREFVIRGAQAGWTTGEIFEAAKAEGIYLTREQINAFRRKAGYPAATAPGKYAG